MGSEELKAGLQLLGLPRKRLPFIQIAQKVKSTYHPVKEKAPGQFELSGTGMVRITWK